MSIEPEIENLNVHVADVFEKNFKSWDELTKYYNCFNSKDSTFSPNDKLAIELAAKHYGLPYQLVFCMLLKESRFETGAKSPVGAQGLAQFMPDTLNYLKVLHKKPSAKALARCQENVDKMSKAVIAYCTTIQNINTYHEEWNQLNQIFQENNLQKGRIPYNANNRIAAIALGAFYLKYLVTQVNEHFDEVWSNPFAVDIRNYKLAAAAYNAGPGRVGRILSKQKVPNKDVAINVVRRIDETRNYIDGMEICMKAGDGNAPTEYERNKKIVCKEF